MTGKEHGREMEMASESLDHLAAVAIVDHHLVFLETWGSSRKYLQIVGSTEL